MNPRHADYDALRAIKPRESRRGLVPVRSRFGLATLAIGPTYAASLRHDRLQGKHKPEEIGRLMPDDRGPLSALLAAGLTNCIRQ